MRNYLNQAELANLWNISERTLERWRWRGEGPPYLKLGGRVIYRHQDIKAYEEHVLHAETYNNRGIDEKYPKHKKSPYYSCRNA